LESKNGFWTYQKHQGLSYSLFLSSNSRIEKSYDGYTIFPVIVAGGLHVPNLVMLSSTVGLRIRKSPTTLIGHLRPGI
jgi:hypothetical protein